MITIRVSSPATNPIKGEGRIDPAGFIIALKTVKNIISVIGFLRVFFEILWKEETPMIILPKI